MPAPVVLVPYDPSWPARFEEERGRLLAFSPPLFVSVEHAGSTAVPGLAAKPILDVLATVRSRDDVMPRVPDLAALGYAYVPEYERDLPERRYFRKGPADGRTHHLHVCAEGGAFHRRHLRFRDVLRAQPDVAAAYEALKRELAHLHRDDREAYTNGKTAFVVRYAGR